MMIKQKKYESIDEMMKEKMKKFNNYDFKLPAASAGGVIVGTGAALATMFGSYELGGMINDYAGIDSTLARGAIDLMVMGLAVTPAIKIGFGCSVVGLGIGTLVGGAANYIAKGVNSISYKISNKYNQIKGDKK